jgi:hypothetical protein
VFLQLAICMSFPVERASPGSDADLPLKVELDVFVIL